MESNVLINTIPDEINDIPLTQSLWKCFANIFTAFMGAGVLAIPYAFKQCGLILGILIMFAVGLLTTIQLNILVDCKKIINIEYAKSNNKNNNLAAFSYSDVGRIAFGRIGEFLVSFCTVCCHLGFSVGYLIFIFQNLSSIFSRSVNSILIKTVTFFILLLLSFIKYIKTLALWSVFSQLSLLFAFSIIAWLDVSNYFLTKNLTIEYFNFNNSLFFIAACVYCYEGAGVVLSLESATSPTIRFGFKRILNCAIFVFFMVNCSFGISGYLSFGKDTQSIITLNLEYKDSHLLHLLNLVKFLICISLMLTFPIMMFPVHGILNKSMSNVQFSPKLKFILIRVTCVIIAFLLYFALPNFEIVMSLVGSLFCTSISLILPVYFHICLCRNPTLYIKCRNYTLLSLSIVLNILCICDAFGKVSKFINS